MTELFRVIGIIEGCSKRFTSLSVCVLFFWGLKALSLVPKGSNFPWVIVTQSYKEAAIATRTQLSFFVSIGLLRLLEFRGLLCIWVINFTKVTRVLLLGLSRLVCVQGCDCYRG
jgi:hypothetical protein